MNEIPAETPPSLIDKLIRFCLEQKLIVALIVLFIVTCGIIVAPFDWNIASLPRHPVSVDAIPDIGENQQILFTEWMGRSPKDVDDQVTYPLTVSLLGIPGVKTVRSYSMFGFSMIYIIFEEDVDFEKSQNRIIARINGLPSGILPDGVKPALGPYATALGQIFWYTLEGRDLNGNPAGGFDIEELRTIQDWNVRYHLQAAEGVTEVASIGGFVQEYQVDVDPDALRNYKVTIQEVFNAVRNSNLDVGARQIELNRAEYLIRAKGFIKEVSDLENTVVKVNNNVPIYIKNIGKITLGPAFREGALDKEGSEAVGGVVVVRHGFNPLAAIKNVKSKISEISDSLPEKAYVDYKLINEKKLNAFGEKNGFEAFKDNKLNQKAWVEWLKTHTQKEWPKGVILSKVTVVPFYDRTGLIYETLGTLNSALYEQVLITTIVIIIMTMHLRSSLLISIVMPLSVLISFIAMKYFQVDANIVSLSGIAIAIGTIVDMGIVICYSIRQRLEAPPEGESTLESVYKASSEVGSAILTAITTTVVGFLPVFVMTGPEGKLFKPLAFTKTFCLLASVIVALTVIPALAHILFPLKIKAKRVQNFLGLCLALIGIVIAIFFTWQIAGIICILCGIYLLMESKLPQNLRKWGPWSANALIILFVTYLLTEHWMPLGQGMGIVKNLFFAVMMITSFMGFYWLVERYYEKAIRLFLAHKVLFLSLPLLITLTGFTALIGADKLFGFIPQIAQFSGINPDIIRQNSVWSYFVHKFPGFGKEFMPSLDEGSYLYMPTTMPHASIGEALDVIQKQDMAIRAIPEIDSVVGKIGRADTALDPAPVNMIETVISYKPEYMTDINGRIILFKYDKQNKTFIRENGELIPDTEGQPYRQWREHIKHPDDIWKEITKAAEIPGTTTAPKLQPIAARIVMLQSGMRAPMGVKVKGPDLESIERAGLLIEKFLKEVPTVESAAVIADRIVGKPYLEIDINRNAIAKYGLSILDVQEVIEVAIGGVTLTQTVEGRKRFPVRVRYMRELRDQIETLGKILIPSMDGAQIPLIQLADIRYVRGPEAVKSEDSFLISYVLFDKKQDAAEVDVVETCQKYLLSRQQSGELKLPPGVSYRFSGSYENQLHAQKTLNVILPMTFFIIFLLIYFQFRSVVTTTIIFMTIFVCWSGGLVLIWLYGQDWFMNFTLFGINARELFQIHPVNMSIAIWVGFLALFGIASDDAVLICTYLDQRFREAKPQTIGEIREAVIYAGKRRVGACLMTTATTILALLPVLTSQGRGSDIMVPMSLPSFGGMLAEVFVMFIAAVLYCSVKEQKCADKIKPDTN